MDTSKGTKSTSTGSKGTKGSTKPPNPQQLFKDLIAGGDPQELIRVVSENPDMILKNKGVQNLIKGMSNKDKRDMLELFTKSKNILQAQESKEGTEGYDISETDKTDTDKKKKPKVTERIEIDRKINLKDQKKCVLITSSGQIKLVNISIDDNTHVIFGIKKETEMKTDQQLTKEELELIGEKLDDSIFVYYDDTISKNRKKGINRRATKLLKFPVAGNVIFYNPKSDIKIEDITKYETQ